MVEEKPQSALQLRTNTIQSPEAIQYFLPQLYKRVLKEVHRSFVAPKGSYCYTRRNIVSYAMYTP